MPAAKPAERGQVLDSVQQVTGGRRAVRGVEESDRKAPDKTGVYRLLGSLGTAVAIIDVSTGDAAFSAKGKLTSWGGARNRADRTSDALTVKQTAEIVAAAQFAARIGLPLNRHVTIHWEASGIPDARAAAATGAFLTLARDWLRKRGASFAWLWVRENGHAKGSHVHILLHCQPELGRALSYMQRRWLRRVTGTPYRRRVIRTSRIGGTLAASRNAPAAYAENLAAVVGYLLKGASPAAATAIGLARVEAGGCVIGKRSATSQNTGRAARKRVVFERASESEL